MGVTVNANDGSGAGTSGTGTSGNYTGLTTTAAATAILVLVAFKIGSGASYPSNVSVVWDPTGANQAFTEVPNARANNATTGWTSLYGLASPSSNGNKTISISWTAPTGTDFYIAGISFAGTDTTTPFTNGTSNTGTSTTASVVVASASGNMAVAVCQDNAAGFSGGNTSGFSGTPIFINQALTYNAGGEYSAGSATVTLSFGLAGTDQWECSGCNVAAPSGVSIPIIARRIIPYQLDWG